MKKLDFISEMLSPEIQPEVLLEHIDLVTVIAKVAHKAKIKAKSLSQAYMRLIARSLL